MRCGVFADLTRPNGTHHHEYWPFESMEEAIDFAHTLFEDMLTMRLTDLVVTANLHTLLGGDELVHICLDDAQMFYDHRMYRIGETDKDWSDRLVPSWDRRDPREYETNMLIGFRDNLDVEIHRAIKKFRDEVC